MGRKVSFIIHIPKGTRINDIRRVDENIEVVVREKFRNIDHLTLADAKKKYG